MNLTPDQIEGAKKQAYLQAMNDHFAEVDALSAQFTKMLFAVNGGALVAILALIAQLHSTEQQELAQQMAVPAAAFLIGLLSVLATVFLHIVSIMILLQRKYGDEELNAKYVRHHKVVRFIRGGLFLLATSTLIYGSLKSVTTLM